MPSASLWLTYSATNALAWDASPDHAKLSTYRIVAARDGVMTNWSTGLILQYDPPLSPGDWTVTCLAVGTNGITSDPSNMLFVRVLPSGLFYVVQTAPTLNGPWTQIAGAIPAPTNATALFFRGELQPQ